MSESSESIYQTMLQKRFSRLAQILSIGAAVSHAFVGLIFFLVDVPEMVWFNFTFSVPLFGISYFINKRGWTSFTFKLSYLELTLHQTAAVYFIGWESGFQFFLLPLTGMSFFHTIWSKKTRIAFSTIPIITFILIYFFIKDHQVYTLSLTAYTVFFMNCSLMTFIGIAFMIHYYVKAVSKAEETLINVNSLLTERNGAIEQSLSYAERIQNAVLPDRSSLKQYFSDAFVIFRPKEVVGGDFYWFCHHENKTMVVCADCTGHGVPGGFLSMLGISYLNELAGSQLHLEPFEMLEALRIRIKQSLNQKGAFYEQKDGMDMSICLFDHQIGDLKYAGANSSIIIISNDMGKVEELKSTRNPVGVYRKEKPFSQITIPLTANDQVYLFSDGFYDQFGGERRKKFGKTRLKQVLMDNAANPAKNQKSNLEESLLKWMNGFEQTDDMTLIGLKI